MTSYSVPVINDVGRAELVIWHHSDNVFGLEWWMDDDMTIPQPFTAVTGAVMENETEAAEELLDLGPLATFDDNVAVVTITEAVANTLPTGRFFWRAELTGDPGKVRVANGPCEVRA